MCRKSLGSCSRQVLLLFALGVGLLVAATGCEPSAPEGIADGGAIARLSVCVTTPDLRSLVETIGGESVKVFTFVQGPDDPHVVESRPAFVEQLAGADLLVVAGLGLEEAWLPGLLESSRNDRVKVGGAGHLDVSQIVEEIEEGQADGDLDAAGHFHPYGNPHYLLDPLKGLKAAALICEKLGDLLPDQADAFHERFEAFAAELSERLLGHVVDAEELLGLRSMETWVSRFESASAGDGTWVAMLAPFKGEWVVSDHDEWVYMARRFGLKMLDEVEPDPGVPPTTSHLQDLIARMQSDEYRVRVILHAPYFDTRHPRFVADRTGGTVLMMAHQTGARAGTDDYISMIDYNVQTLSHGLSGAR